MNAWWSLSGAYDVAVTYDIDRSLLPTRRWVEGFDGGRNYLSQTLILAIGCASAAMAVAALFAFAELGQVSVAIFVSTGSMAGLMLLVVIGTLALAESRAWLQAQSFAGDIAMDTGPGISFALRSTRLHRVLPLVALMAIGTAAWWTWGLWGRSQAHGWASAIVLVLVVPPTGTAVVGLLLLAPRWWNRRHHALRAVLCVRGIGLDQGEVPEFLEWDQVKSIEVDFWSPALSDGAKGMRLVAVHPIAAENLTMHPESVRAWRVLRSITWLAGRMRNAFIIPLEQMEDHPSVVVYAVRFYAAHPESRSELGDGRALHRLGAVLAGPIYSDQP